MTRLYSSILLLTLSICSTSISFSAECDQPASQESVRIYFANGMGNTRENADDSREELQRILGMTDRDFGSAYNDNENWFIQLLQVYKQRKNSSDDFWYWLRNMDKAPQWFHDEYVERVSRFNDQLVQSDPDLARHIQQYLADLNSGKKVVIVAHSQGNFYANNAYRHISIYYPDYKDSIGVVSVATPATWVEGGGQYNINDVYTTNPEDLIINLVRAFYSDTLPANAPAYDNPDSKIDHEFVSTYLSGYTNRIRDQILHKIMDLDVPEKEYDCKGPSEVPVVVNTTFASSISSTTARLNGYVVSGKEIAKHCIWRKAASGNPATCLSYQDRIAQTGPLDTGESFDCTATGLSPGTDYRFRMCGREGSRISDGGVKSFRTSGTQCGSAVSYSGGSNGLSVTYGMGSSSGESLVEFEAYTIPDKLEIWQGGNLIYATKTCNIFGCSPAYVSGYHWARVYHNPSYGNTWEIRVYGNSNTDTAWNLNISCPN